MLWVLRVVIAIGVFGAAALGLAAYGRARWSGSTRTLLGRLEAARLPPTASHYDAHELEGLLAPVQRYFRAVLKDGQRIIVAATLCDRSHVRLSVRGELQDFTEARLTRARIGVLCNLQERIDLTR
jgi:hypothetical protein